MPNLKKATKQLISLNFIKQTANRYAVLFPHARPAHPACGSVFSALRPLLLVAGLLPGVVHAAEAEEQIDQALERHFTQAVASETEAQGWQGARFSHTSTPLNSTANLPACKQAVAVSRVDDNPSLLARQRLEISCPDQPGWTVTASSQVSIFLPAVFSSRAIERGQTISAEQLTLQELDIGKAQRGFFDDIDDVVGMGAKRRIRANQALSPGLLAMPLLVRRGQQVKILASHDGIEASTMGEALENGRRKAVIRVRNLSSGKTIEAKVLDTGIVTSTFR